MQLVSRAERSLISLRSLAMRTLAVSLFLLALCALGCCETQLNGLPGCTIDKLEACGTDYVIYANTTNLPVEGESFTQQCRLILEQLSCSIAFCRRCLSGFPRAVALLGLRSAEEFYEESCDLSTDLYQSYKVHVKCLNKAGKGLNERLNKVLQRLYAIKETVRTREKIGHACCLYPEFLHDTAAIISKQCPDPEVKEFFHGFMERIFGELLGVACGKYREGSENCRRIQPVTPSEAVKAKAKNFVEPMLDIVHSLGSRGR
ncbi:uncharacterized protein LOC135398243 [Ornithodoros turicata]|uniref:uncharacterized protein LOC135398243 n=1 Tax=Ornithodoros turicata TaxID=34597 RepID=UPI0031395AB1